MKSVIIYVKRIGTIFGTIFTVFISFIASIICFSLSWMFQTWSNLTMDELLYHLNTPLEGTNTSMVEQYIGTCITPSILIFVAVIIGFVGIRHKKKYYFYMLFIILGSLILIFFSLWNAGIKLDIENYTKSKGSYSKFIEEYYVDPSSVAIEFPEQKRNLVYIFLESMEISYANKKVGGAFEKNVIPELTKMALENEDFSGDIELINGAHAMSGTTWTMGAMFAHTAGLPLNISIEGNSMDTQESFFSGVVTLGDILREEGYSQTLLIGSDATFGGRRLYFTEHGQYDILDYKYAIENGWIPEDYYVWWGYEDQKLFQFAKQRLLELSKQNSPFNLTILTVDTHFEDGYICDRCENNYDNQYANVMACSSKEIFEFVEWMKMQDFFENTTIVLVGDHATMDSDFCENVSKEFNRKVYVSYINALAERMNNDFREYTTFDLFPTTLASLGVSIEGERLGLGVNLFSSVQTLVERFDLITVQQELQKNSKLLEELADLDTDKKELLVREGKSPKADINVGVYDFQTGLLPVGVTNIQNLDSSEIQTIMMKVWTNDDQSDLQWIPLQNDGMSNFNGNINVPSFGYKVGSYYIQVVAINENGEQYVLGEGVGTVE